MPTFFGSIVRDTGREILFAVAADRGDARAFGLCGQIWFAKRQIIECPDQESFAVIKVPYAVAAAKSLACQPCE